MSKDIILKTGEFSKRSLLKAESALESADAFLHMIASVNGSKTFRSLNYCPYNANNCFFSDVTIEKIVKNCKAAMSASAKLKSISKFLDDGPERLLAVDRKRKGDYTTAWNRAANRVGGGISAIGDGISSLWNNLFGKNKNKTGNAVVINPYGYLADRFDWEETDATTEEIDSVITSAMKNVKPGESIEEAIQRELESFYNERRKYSCNAKALLDDIINNEIGSGPRKYWSWYYGRNSDRTDGWCATFVSYIMAQAGIDVNSPTKEKVNFRTHPLSQAQYLKSKNCYHDKNEGYSPKTGDLVFFDNIEGGNPVDHVGMIYVADDGTVYVIHGNWGDPGKVCMSKLYDDYGNSKQKLIDCVTGYGDIQALATCQSNAGE